MIFDLGYKQRDFAATMRAIRHAKNHRKQTVDNLRFQGIEEKMEKTNRTIKNIITLGFLKQGKKKEKEAWKTLVSDAHSKF
jgi:hypothetical protein